MALMPAAAFSPNDMNNIPHNAWTDEERAMLRRLRANGLGLKACAAMMGRSYHSVTRQIRYLGLQMRVEASPQPKPEPPKRVRAGASLPPLPSLRHDGH